MLSRMTLMIGMAPPTDASKRIWRPKSLASSNSAAPRVASSGLLAVTTSLPLRSAWSTNVKAAVDPADQLDDDVDRGVVEYEGRVAVNSSAGAPWRSSARFLSSNPHDRRSTPVASRICACSLLDQPA